MLTDPVPELEQRKQKLAREVEKLQGNSPQPANILPSVIEELQAAGDD